MNSKYILWLSLVLGVCFLTRKVYCQVADDTDYLGDDEEEASEEEEENAPPPVIRSQPLNITVKPGDTVFLPCEIDNFSVTHHTVLWRKDMQGLWTGSIKQITDSRFNKLPNNTLEISKVEPSDSGRYVCQVPAQTSIEVVHTLHVISKAKIIQMSPAGPEFILRKGETLSLTCLASGYPEPRITWSRNDNVIKTWDPTIKVITMAIDNVTRKHAGKYECKASNGPDMVDTKSVDIHIHYPPEIEIERDTVTTAEGYESELICNVHAVPKAKVLWLFNGHLVVQSKHLVISKDGNKHTLHIKNTKTTDFGQYTCFANNTEGAFKKNLHLSGKPAQPKFDSATVDSQSHNAVLVWKIESYSPIIEYELLYKLETEEEWKSARPTVESTSGNIFTAKHKLTGLQPGSYQTKLKAKNQYGWSQLSDTQVFSGEFEASDPSETGLLESVKEASTASELRISAVLVFSLLFARFCC